MYFPPKCSLQTVVNAEWRIELKINSDSFMTKAEMIMKDSLFLYSQCRLNSPERDNDS